MTELLSVAQMRAAEAEAMRSGAATGLQLMERAGRGAVAAMLEEWPDLVAGRWRAVVLCGPGNNGGDGYVVARRLADRGWAVEVLALGDPARLGGDAAKMRALWTGPVAGLDEAGAGPRPGLLVDALFGTGLTRPLPWEAITAMRAVRDRAAGQPGERCRVLAIDCPSGLNCDTGRVDLPPSGDDAPEDAEARSHSAIGILSADLTVTFHAPKRGHYLEAGPGLCQRLRVVDIGLEPSEAPSPVEPPASGRVRLVGARSCAADLSGDLWPGQLLRPGAGDHKYRRGHVLVVSGGVGRGGAARLAARTALRIGAGLVTIGCPPAALQENAARLDAVMLRPLRDAAALEALLSDPRISGLVLGPGAGVGARTREMVGVALAARRGTVLDADALTSFAEAPEELFAQLHPGCVLTPHDGEFARLFPDLARRDRQTSRVDAALAAAARAGAVVLLKGVDTVIASPEGRAAVHVAAYGRSAPWLGTAGAGDVLSGMIAGLLAPGASAPQVAAEAAAWLHVEAARRFGPGLIAEDLPEILPAVFRDLGL
ncbi:NAD(P)H-hydrate dehydratase [Roseisalinus antarcticus]|uniref:Bifunctional NAD(P)H-hydrate repair enzyme n=1 Tax=Roseisalinus antarcticus TaxID=254357 RepID=A0A1Y5T429_9RHOB|nr:NAD(P)H-hydrate dehydratase [Roseisalinus antarcticus]SLN54776.1 Bifunctional NAD(P)H-hydrate repair enzyme Nnr [Roseisalinus antarcticus]